MRIPRFALLLPLAACAPAPSRHGEQLAFDAASASAAIDHPHLPLRPGTTFRDEGAALEDGTPIVRTRHVSHFTPVVAGIECRWTVAREFHGDELREERHEFAAQEGDGDVWLVAVAATQLEGDAVVGREGSFTAEPSGRGAQLLLPREWRVGDEFALAGGGRGERWRVASDRAVVSAEALGTWTGCLHLEAVARTSDPAGLYFAPGVGEVARVRTDGALVVAAIADDAAPALDPAAFVAAVDHPFLPLPPGRVLRYAGWDDDGMTALDVEVLDARATILGVDCTTVASGEWKDGVLVEEALDWFAQDGAGNVWYFGSLVVEHHDGTTRVGDDSWLAGVDGATIGLEMPGAPRVGDSFRQENAPGHAEDVAAIHAIGRTAWTPLGRRDDCLELLEKNALEPDSESEFKLFAPGIGLVDERDAARTERLFLVAIEEREGPFSAADDRDGAGAPRARGSRAPR